jgi:alpha-D-xyloside xylohydrolase
LLTGCPAVVAGPTARTITEEKIAAVLADAGKQARGDDFAALCRSGTAGGQRFAAHWAGDLPATWSGLTSTLRALLSMSLSGLSTVTCDAGGYWTPQSYERTRDARRTMAPGQLIAEVDPELYARWRGSAGFSELTIDDPLMGREEQMIDMCPN